MAEKVILRAYREVEMGQVDPRALSVFHPGGMRVYRHATILTTAPVPRLVPWPVGGDR